MEMCPFPTEIFSISHISSFDIVHMWWTLWIILEGKCECLKFLQFHTLQKWSPHIVTKLVGKISGFHQASSIKTMPSSIFWILSMLSHSFTKTKNNKDFCTSVIFATDQIWFSPQFRLILFFGLKLHLVSSWFHNLNPRQLRRPPGF